MKNTLKVGQTVYIVNIRTNKITSEKIGIIGTKYFYLDDSFNTKFSKIDMFEKSDYMSMHKAYLEKQTILDELQYKELLRNLKNKIERPESITLKQLVDIEKILK